jgi:enoyl-CoA hydratase
VTDVKYEVEDRVATVTLDRPHTRNALSMGMRREIVDALHTADSDSEVSVVVIASSGSNFCSGYDLSEPYGSAQDRSDRPTWVKDGNLQGWTDQFNRSCVADWLTLFDLLKPVVAIVAGNCLGGGVELLGMADIAYVAEDARIGYPPVRGMSTPDVPVFAWKTTMARAKYLQLTGASLTGKEAADWGIVAKCFPADELTARARAEIAALATVDSALLAANKHQVNAAYEQMGMRTHLHQAWMWHHLSGSVRPKHDAFFESVRSIGMRAALDAMNAPFNDADLH